MTRTATLCVPDRRRPWSVPWPDYAPVEITTDELRGPTVPDWAEPGDDPADRDWPARQAAAVIPFDVVDGRPRNPAGRTGRTGRNLRDWGENATVDPIVIAEDDLRGRYVLLIRREDSGQWALPGGHIDPGEAPRDALPRELREETGLDLSGLDPVELVRGVVDDPRGTDEAWIATVAALYRLSDRRPVHGGSDALDARWWPLGSLAALTTALRDAGDALYPAHRPLLALAEQHLTATS